MKEYHVSYIRARKKVVGFSVKADSPEEAEQKVLAHIKKEGMLSFYYGLRVFKPSKKTKIDYVL